MMSLLSRATLVLAALSLSGPVTAQTDLERHAKTDVVLDWNAIAMTAVSSQNGVEQVRLATIVHLAVFEAVNAIVGGFAPYLGTIVAPDGASPEAAAVAASHAVLVNYLPADQIAALDDLRERSLDGIPAGPEKDAGIAVGDAAAAAMIQHRENDGAQPAERYVPTSTDPGQWQQTPSCMEQGGLFLHWRHLTPFGIARADQFRADLPPPLTSRRFARDYNEVKTVGGVDSQARTKEWADIARFFAAVQSQHAWNPIARQIAIARRTSLAANARLFALLNMAMNDALVAVIDTKYHYTFWRPETAIVSGDTDNNPDTEPDSGFTPFIAAPCHPSYASAHASSSYAAREVLERLFDDGRHFIALASPLVPGVELRYTRLAQITHDIDGARIYGGIHFRFDQEEGARQGRRIGRYVVAHNLSKDRRRVAETGQ